MARPAWRRRRLLPPRHPSKWATPGLSIHPAIQLLLLTPYPPVDPAHQSPPAWTAGPARQRPAPASSRPPSAVNPVHAAAPPAELPSLLPRSLPPPLPPKSQSLLRHPLHPRRRRRAFTGSGDGRFSARVLAGVASRRAGPPNLRRAAAPLAPQDRARSRFSCYPELSIYRF